MTRTLRKISEGFVYVIWNPAKELRWCSVGRSIDPIKRLSSYNRADPFRGFVLYFAGKFSNCLTAERAIHARLAAHGVESEGEWFKCPPSFAQRIIEEVQSEGTDR